MPNLTLSQTLDYPKTLTLSFIETPIGRMYAITSEKSIYCLQFTARLQLQKSIDRLLSFGYSKITKGETRVSLAAKKELGLYFKGDLKNFTITMYLLGTHFQKKVWNTLQLIPFGETRSYAMIAQSIGKPRSYRGIAQANSANPVHIIIPCHRVIYSTGSLGGYKGGIEKKKWLLNHEKLSNQMKLC